MIPHMPCAQLHHQMGTSPRTHCRNLLGNLKDLLEQKPPAHYRTASCSPQHILRMSLLGTSQCMHPRNHQDSLKGLVEASAVGWVEELVEGLDWEKELAQANWCLQ